MDLLGDIGLSDQLTSARTENAALHERVKELSSKLKILRVENESLKAEVEQYRQEMALPRFSNLALGEEAPIVEERNNTWFLKSGDGIFPDENQLTLTNIHNGANPLCCALSMDDTIVATGGADSSVRLVQWGLAHENPSFAVSVVEKGATIHVDAPVICADFSHCVLKNTLAAGCMDGSVKLIQYETLLGGAWNIHTTNMESQFKHRKYVRAVAWSSLEPILATASADGDIHIYRVEKPDPFAVMMSDEDSGVDLKVAQLQSLHLNGPVESLCFCESKLLVYARGSPFLSFFDLANDCKATQLNLNRATAAATGGFDDHVSFCIMDMALSPDKRFLAAATDTNRNIVLDINSGKQVRNLYGHRNDGFSQPKLTWSRSGQYVLGNTQDEPCVCVWDIASSRITGRLQGHASPIRAMCSGHNTDCLVTTSFDRKAMLWFPKSTL